MNQGVRTIIYPVRDMARAKLQFRTLLGVDPYGDSPYYIGFKVGNQDIGLVPNAPEAGMTAFYHVDDIKQSLQALEELGSQILREIQDVGGGRLVASVKDPDGNIIGLIQDQGALPQLIPIWLARMIGRASDKPKTFTKRIFS